MKKHPVDELFKKKLDSFEMKPSQHAWDRIQATQGTKEKKLAGWVGYAAASVVVTLMAGYAVWNYQPDKLNVEANKNLVKTEKVPVVVPVDKNVETTPAAPNFVPHKIKNDDDRVVVVEKSRREKREKKQGERTLRNEKVLIAGKSEFNVNQIETPVHIESVTRIDEEIQAVMAKADPLENRAKAMVQEHPQKTEREATGNRVIVVHVETAESDVAKGPSRFTKVFRQLKNARAGEAVDWEEVGFNPKNLVAKVDDKVRNEEEKVTEKYQHLKEKTKL